MARRSELKDSSSHGEISSSTIWPLSYCQKAITHHLLVNTPHDNEDPPSFPRRSPNKVSRNRRTQTQLRKTSARDHRRRTRMGGRKDHQFPTPRTTQEAPIPCSMEGIPTIRRFLGSRVGSLHSRPDRRLLQHTFPRPSTTVI